MYVWNNGTGARVFRQTAAAFQLADLHWLDHLGSMPIHPCQHSPSSNATRTIDIKASSDEAESPSLLEEQCLCSKEAQIELDPELQKLQDHWFRERDNIWYSNISPGFFYPGNFHSMRSSHKRLDGSCNCYVSF